MNQPNEDDSPFFLVGCVRSGTTLLRDLLKAHPRLACPQETHFFRWPHPYGSAPYLSILRNNATLREHRRLDGISDTALEDMLEVAPTRRDLQDRYAAQFLASQPAGKRRWFDKTPQHVYGLLMLAGAYPEAKFVHLHRHPYNVVASLKAGKVMGKHSLGAAINYWLEAILIVRQFAAAWPQRVLEISYERLTSDSARVLDEITDYLGEAPGAIHHERFHIHEEKNKYRKELSADEVNEVRRLLAPYMQSYGYA